MSFAAAFLVMAYVFATEIATPFAPVTCEPALTPGPTPPGNSDPLSVLAFHHNSEGQVHRWIDQHGLVPGVFRVGDGTSKEVAPGITMEDIYVVVGPEASAQVLRRTDFFDRMYDGPTMRLRTKIGQTSALLLGTNGEEGQEWRHAHAALIPFFRRGFVEDTYTPLVRDLAARVTERLVPGRSKKIADLRGELSYYSLATVFESLFKSELGYPLSETLLHSFARIFNDASPEEAQTTNQEFTRLVAPLVERAKAEMATRAAKVPSGSQGEIPKQIDDGLITHLLAVQQRDGLPESWVYDQIITVYFAGQLTTKEMLAMAMFMLAEHPQYQKALRREYADFRAGRIADLKQAKNFLNEVLRVFPPIPDLARRARQDVNLAGYFIPKGARLMVKFYTGFMREETWGANPREFRPERHDEVNVPPRYFCPFGAGARVCIGQHVAILEGSLWLGELLQRYYVSHGADFVAPQVGNFIFEVEQPVSVVLRRR